MCQSVKCPPLPLLALETCIIKESKSNEHSMRKIERLMNTAITNSENFRLDNTEVRYDEQTGESKVYLHGNHIATVGENFVEIFDGGYQTVTTKSRLNAICSEHGIAGEGVFQRAYQWFVRVSKDGGKTFQTEEFSGSYCFV